MKDFTNIIDLWPSRTDFAQDCGVDYGVVHQWHRRNSIPPKYWNLIVDGAASRSVDGVTYELLANLAQKAETQQ